MQKLTTTELHWAIRELENAAEEFMQMTIKTENNNERALLKLRAENLYSVAEKMRIAIDNEDKHIAIL
jgi:hypothetical protein